MLWVSIVILLSNRHKCWVCTHASLPPGPILVNPKQIHQTRIYLNHLKSDLYREPILLFFCVGLSALYVHCLGYKACFNLPNCKQHRIHSWERSPIITERQCNLPKVTQYRIQNAVHQTPKQPPHIPHVSIRSKAGDLNLYVYHQLLWLSRGAEDSSHSNIFK